MGSGGWEATEVEQARMEYNNRMAAFETALLDDEFGGGVSKLDHFTCLCCID